MARMGVATRARNHGSCVITTAEPRSEISCRTLFAGSRSSPCATRLRPRARCGFCRPRRQRRLLGEHVRRLLASPVGSVGAVLRAVLVLGLSRGQRLEELEDGVGSLEPLAVAVRQERDLVLANAVLLAWRDLLRDEVEPELCQPLPHRG